MRMKFVTPILLTVLFASNAFATYIVVLKDGTRYRARDKWTVVAGKATIVLDNGGSTMQFDPNMIDLAETDRTNKAGIGDARLLAVGGRSTSDPKKVAPSLGSLTRNKKDKTTPAAVAGTGTNIRETPSANVVPPDVMARFRAAYENMALYQNQVEATGRAALRIKVIADNEDQVRKAISATSYIMAKLPSATGNKVETIELNLETVRGTAAGRFMMTFEDAVSIDSKKTTWGEYYVNKVIF